MSFRDTAAIPPLRTEALPRRDRVRPALRDPLIHRDCPPETAARFVARYITLRSSRTRSRERCGNDLEKSFLFVALVLRDRQTATDD